ncbi:MAG: molybdate ABC transporter substrate-binding protein [Nitrospirota bacterium]
MRTVLLPALVFLAGSMLSLPPASAEPAREITVSAALSLKSAFEEIGKRYEAKYKRTRVAFNFGPSGDLVRQIEAGAPVDVFASAAPGDMDALDRKGLVIRSSRTDFAANAVVLVVPAAATASIRSFEDLATKGVKRIAIGNPKTAPVGRYAEEVFRYYRIFDAVEDKLVLAGNVRQVLDYVARGEVDAGVVYATDAMTRPKEVRGIATAPAQSHKPVLYPLAVVRGTKNERPARAFIDAVTSPEGKRILEKYGFTMSKN